MADGPESKDGPVLPVDLETVRIQSLPAEAYYIADFITVEEEEAILAKV